MALPVNIDDLINHRKVEWARIEYKEGWNPERVLHTLCAFANDIDNWGGGYVILGVAEKDGRPVFPVKGLAEDEIDAISKDLLEKCHLLDPVYMPVVEPVEFEGKQLMVIWVPGGPERPYKCPVAIRKDAKSEKAYYIRKMSSTVRASRLEEKELFQLAGDVPFDDRPNVHADVADRAFIQRETGGLTLGGAGISQKNAQGNLQAGDGDNLQKSQKHVGITAEEELSLIGEQLRGAWKISQKISQKTLSAKSLDRWSRIVQAILRDGSVTAHGLSEQLNATYRTIQSDMRTLKELNAIVRKGSDKGGEWIVIL